MASFELRDTQRFPPGTAVKVYQALGGAHPFPGQLPPAPGQAPPVGATVVSEGTMGSEKLLLSGLADDTPYVVGGEVLTVWEWMSFRTPRSEASVVVETGGGLTEAEADGRYLQLYEVVLAKTVSANVVLPSVLVATKHLLTWAAASPVVTLPAALKGAGIDVLGKQDGSGSRTPSFAPAAGETLLWAAGTQITWTATPGALDRVVFDCFADKQWLASIPGQEYQ